VAWLIHERPSLRAVFEQTLADARAVALGPKAASSAAATAATAAAAAAADSFAFAGSHRFGVLDAVEKARVQIEAWALVIDPGARALLRKSEFARDARSPRAAAQI